MTPVAAETLADTKPSASAKNRPPSFFDSDDVATLLAAMALDPLVPADPRCPRRPATWLGVHKPTDTTQAAAYRLLAKVRAGMPAKTLQPVIDQFLGRQQKDGAWSQVPDRSSQKADGSWPMTRPGHPGVTPGEFTVPIIFR